MLQSAAGNLGRVNNALLHQVAVLANCGIKAVIVFALHYLVADNRTLKAGVLRNQTDRHFNGSKQELNAGILVFVLAFEISQLGLGAQQSDTAAGTTPSSTAARVE